MRYLLFICLSILFLQSSFSQSDEMAVRQPIDALFTAMSKHDTNGVRAVFFEDATLETILTRGDEMKIKASSLADFVRGIGGAAEYELYEHLWSYDIHMDGRLAAVWTPYTFYLNGEISHCGANAFQLIKVDDTWKIRHIIDTRSKTGCREAEKK